MKYPTIIFCLLAFAALLGTACESGNASQTEKSAEELAAESSAYDEMMEAHDRIMMRMGDINQASRALRARLDSAGLPDSLQQQYLVAITDLEVAEDGMMEWMAKQRDFPLDTLQANRGHAGVLEYIAAEQTRIEEVERLMDESIERARALAQE